jgi:hypothetical protein
MRPSTGRCIFYGSKCQEWLHDRRRTNDVGGAEGVHEEANNLLDEMHSPEVEWRRYLLELHRADRELTYEQLAEIIRTRFNRPALNTALARGALLTAKFQTAITALAELGVQTK